jgi:GNAT superfamily N-acetyltransferase
MVEFSEFDPRPNLAPPLSAADGLEIREAVAGDLPALARIAAERDGGDVEAHERSFRNLLQERAQEGRALVLTAILAGEAIGFGKVRYFAPPADSPPNVAPEGWYLAGLVVTPRFRKRGVGSRLTQARLAWLAARTGCAYSFANALNAVSVTLHLKSGFHEITRDFVHPSTQFSGGVGILFRADL